MRNDNRNTMPCMGRGTKSLKEVLRDNVWALMDKKYGGEQIQQLARDAKVGAASIDRIKKAETSVGLEIVEKIARSFGVDAYQLLCPTSMQESFAIVCRAYSFTDERGRLLLSATAEALLRSAGADVAGKANG